MSLARCDAALGNFLTLEGGGIIACDFEMAQLRPRGWDFVMTFIALLQTATAEAEDLLMALAKGCGEEHSGALMTEEMCQLARIVTCACASAGASDAT